ncbi:DUF3718 domain-containing protein [Shewanella sp. Isolate11]|uniref:DUF3718 domain-containing protein n=1 Tax=Shewanella sp. Isolate11 TaxID=2908530 RepID=UPI001EFD7F63|nr:DUF3718 domain-containing protein [Shewanella sp. Isolate11]MCG9696140.1 DUF3718 domain-containing protein [Shewanella sp. Isolate11]
MNKLCSIAVIALAPLAFNAQAAMSPQMEKTLVAVCKAGASNNMIQFNGTLKEYRINEQRVFPRLVCNGENFHQFALNQGADRTARKIAPYTATVTIKDIAMTYGSDQIMAVNY